MSVLSPLCFRSLLALTGVALLLSCAEAPQEQAPAQEEGEAPEGALAFQVRGIEAEEVLSMWAVLVPTPESEPYRDNPVYRIPLLQDGRDWLARENRIFVGTYQVRVFAFDKFIHEEAVVDVSHSAIFASAPREVEVEHNRHKTLTFLLYEQGASERLDLLRFLSVEFDRALVEQWEKLAITVEASGGETPLRDLWGDFLPGDVEGIAPGQAGRFGPPARFAGATEAQLEWTPPRRENTYTFLLGISNEGGDEAELAVSVDVGVDIGDINFQIDFNHAPEALVQTVLDNSVDGTSVQFTTTFSDPEEMDIHYEWSHTCPADFRWISEAPQGTTSSGSTLVFELSDKVPGGRPGRIHDPTALCVLRLALEDTGGSRRLQRLEIPIGMLQPGIGAP